MKKLFLFLLLMASPIYSQESPPANDPLEKYPEYFAEELKKNEEVGDSRFFEEFVQMMIYLIGIVAFMVLFMWILKKMMTVRIEQSNRGSAIKILESRPLSQKTTLYAIEVYGSSYLIAESINGVAKLGEILDKKESSDPSNSI